jgi:hypothetical protein
MERKMKKTSEKIILCRSIAIQRYFMMFMIFFLVMAMQVFADSQNLNSILEHKKALQIQKFPIGFWNYTNLKEHGQYFTAAEVNSWADAGFTIAQSPQFDPADSSQVAQMHQILDWSYASGIKVVIRDPRTSPQYLFGDMPIRDVNAYKNQINNAVREFGNCPAVFGFSVSDEPNKSEYQKCSTVYAYLKEAAPQLHPFLNLLPYYQEGPARVGEPNWPVYLDKIATQMHADFLCYDCYSQMAGNLDNYYENLRLYREASIRNSVPFWTTLLCVGHYHYRCPTYDELRWQFNTAVCSGAKGIMWYFYYMRLPHYNYRFSPVDEFWEKTQTYYDLRRIQRSFHRRYKDLFLNLDVTRVGFYPKAYGGGEVFIPGDIVSYLVTVPAESPLLVGEFIDSSKRPYIMVVNNSLQSNVHVTLRFCGKKTRLFTQDWNGNEQESVAWMDYPQRWRVLESSIEVDHWLAPGQELVYRVDANSQK